MKNSTDIIVAIEDPAETDIRRLLDRHLQAMNASTPPESVHALDLDALRTPSITFYTARRGRQLLGCGALKHLDDGHGEIKSMHTAVEARGQGIARVILTRMIGDAVSRGYRRLSLETGSDYLFAPARSLYEKFGFDYCEPFCDYTLDPHSVYLSKEL